MPYDIQEHKNGLDSQGALCHRRTHDRSAGKDHTFEIFKSLRVIWEMLT